MFRPITRLVTMSRLLTQAMDSTGYAEPDTTKMDSKTVYIARNTQMPTAIT